MVKTSDFLAVAFVISFVEAKYTLSPCFKLIGLLQSESSPSPFIEIELSESNHFHLLELLLLYSYYHYRPLLNKSYVLRSLMDK